MNEIVAQIQSWYRNEREMSNYSIMDIGDKLRYLAEKGLIWILKDMKDITEFEKIVIDYFLNKYRGNQIYDNLDLYFYLKPSIESPKTTPQSPQKNVSLNKPKKKKKNILEVRDVKRFAGYQKAKELEERIIEICKNFPSYDTNIVDQIERSSESIKRGIAMGEQMYIGEKFYQYSIAIGSAKETSTWLKVSLGQQYISQEQCGELDNLVIQIVSILTRTLVNLKEKEGQGIDLPSPYTPNVKKFDAYNQALQLVERIYEITREQAFWREKSLVSNLRNYSTSCVANLAEGHQLFVPMMFRFFNDALQALDALDSLLETSVSKQIVTEKSIADIRKLRESIRNILTKRLSNISKLKDS